MLSRDLIKEIDECLFELENASNILASKADDDSEYYISLAAEFQLARIQLPYLIKKGEFVNEEAETFLNKLFNKGADVMRAGGLPFLALHAQQLTSDMFFGDV